MEDSMLAHVVFSVGVLFVLISIFTVAANYIALYQRHRNRERGSKERPSMIFLAPQVLLVIAYMVFRNVPVYPVPGWLLLGIALLDPGIWFIASLPFVKRSAK